MLKEALEGIPSLTFTGENPHKPQAICEHLLNVMCFLEHFVPKFRVILLQLLYPGNSRLYLPALPVIVKKDMIIQVPQHHEVGQPLTGLQDAEGGTLEGM
ncbi:hypothetical protein E2320_014325 [Naja naja]|nr:hypothetical protein E2320_014325 [Naja naja]